MENGRENISVANQGTPFLAAFHPSMSWRSIVGGVLVSLLAFATMTSLGVAIGGVSLYDGASLSSAGTYGGLWVLLAVIVALFSGSYFTARISNFSSRRIGAGQGLVVASVFFGLLVWQAIGAFNATASAIGDVMGGVAQVAAPLGNRAVASGQVQTLASDLIEDGLGNTQLRGNPEVVTAGIAKRLIRGDTVGAKSYLANNSNLTTAEIDSRMASLQTSINYTLVEARKAAAKAMQVSGWSILAIFLFGSVASVIGGGLGSTMNTRVPMTQDNAAPFNLRRPAFAS